MAHSLKAIGKRIARLREKFVMTQAELGKRANYTKDAISRIELGKADKVTFATLANIAEALGVDFTMLLGKRSDEPDQKRARLLAQMGAALRRRSTREIEAAVNVVQEFLFALGEAGRPPAHRKTGRAGRRRRLAERFEKEKQALAKAKGKT